MNTFYRKVLHVALVSRKGGSISPEEWLSLTGTVAHFDPEYSLWMILLDIRINKSLAPSNIWIVYIISYCFFYNL